MGKLSWSVTTTQVNSALHLSGVNKSSTSFGWGKGGKVAASGWQVTLCDSIWHVISRSAEVISRSAISVYFTLLYFTTSSFIHCTFVPRPCEPIYATENSTSSSVASFGKNVQQTPISRRITCSSGTSRGVYRSSCKQQLTFFSLYKLLQDDLTAYEQGQTVNSDVKEKSRDILYNCEQLTTSQGAPIILLRQCPNNWPTGDLFR